MGCQSKIVSAMVFCIFTPLFFASLNEALLKFYTILFLDFFALNFQIKAWLLHPLICSIIQSVCDTCVDNYAGHFDRHSTDLGKLKKHRHSAVGSVSDIQPFRRSVAPSSTQVFAMIIVIIII